MQGAFGLVTIHQIKDQKVAVKRFKTKCETNEFEIQIASSIQGPHFPAFIEKIEPRPDAPYGGFVQQYAGQTLDQYILTHGKRLPKDILMQIYDAITHLHCHNIIHRDVKFENMTIDNGVVYLIDFGLACFEDSEDNKYTCGTFPYMPISAHLGIKRTFASDLESLGYCILALNSRKFRTLPLKELPAYKQDFVNRQQYEETSIFHKIQTYLKYTLDPLATQQQIVEALLALGK